MTAPTIETILDDSKNSGVIYRILAYCQVTKDEGILAVRVYLSGRKRKPKRGDLVTIITVIGHDD